MSQMIDAIYENGIFRPLSPVDLPEGTGVRIAAGGWPVNTGDLVREHLLSAGTTPAEIERILDNFRLLWGSYDSLTEQQQVELDESRPDQEHFFDHHLNNSVRLIASSRFHIQLPYWPPTSGPTSSDAGC